jgi:uncharacterized protein YozE (UPF0346 family)
MSLQHVFIAFSMYRYLLEHRSPSAFSPKSTFRNATIRQSFFFARHSHNSESEWQIIGLSNHLTVQEKVSPLMGMSRNEILATLEGWQVDGCQGE